MTFRSQKSGSFAALRSLAVAASLVGTGGSAAAITGQSYAASGFEDQIVMILRRAAKSAGFCSAVVIAPDVVLTAAHCVGPAGDLRLFFRDGGSAPTFLEPNAVAIHPGYRPDAQTSRKVSIDLALVHLATALPARFKPVVLAGAVTAEIGAPVRLLGFGVTQEGAPATSGHLRLGLAAVRAPRSAVLLWIDAPHGTGACTGDSGGGVFAPDSPSLLAIIAWAEGDAGHHCGALTQATWIAPHLGWIASVRERWAKL